MWKESLEILKSEGKRTVFNSLNTARLKLKENFVAELILDSDAQKSFYEQERTPLVKFIREKLNNYSFQFELKKSKTVKTLEPYSPQEKFEYMANKNPHLLTLKQKLDLDIE